MFIYELPRFGAFAGEIPSGIYKIQWLAVLANGWNSSDEVSLDLERDYEICRVCCYQWDAVKLLETGQEEMKIWDKYRSPWKRDSESRLLTLRGNLIL